MEPEDLYMHMHSCSWGHTASSWRIPVDSHLKRHGVTGRQSFLVECCKRLRLRNCCSFASELGAGLDLLQRAAVHSSSYQLMLQCAHVGVELLCSSEIYVRFIT